MERKSQIQLIETIMVSLILVIIIFIGFIIFMRIKMNETTTQIEFERKEQALLVSELILKTPLLSSTHGIDLYKAMALGNYSDEIKDILGYGNMSIVILYPYNEKILIYNNTFNHANNVPSSFISFYYPINVYDPITDVNMLAILELKREVH